MPVETESKQSLAPWFTLMVTAVPHAAVIVIVPVRKAPGFVMTYTLKLPLFDPVVGKMETHDKDSETVQLEFEVTLTG